MQREEGIMNIISGFIIHAESNVTSVPGHIVFRKIVYSSFGHVINDLWEPKQSVVMPLLSAGGLGQIL